MYYMLNMCMAYRIFQELSFAACNFFVEFYEIYEASPIFHTHTKIYSYRDAPWLCTTRELILWKAVYISIVIFETFSFYMKTNIPQVDSGINVCMYFWRDGNVVFPESNF